MARKRMTSLLLSALAMLAVGVAAAQAAKGKHNASHAKHAKFAWHDSGATTPIKHLVVVFQENVSFDHYFATYPYAANPPGEPSFAPKRNTPSVNGPTSRCWRPTIRTRCSRSGSIARSTRPRTRITTTPTSRMPSTTG